MKIHVPPHWERECNNYETKHVGITHLQILEEQHHQRQNNGKRRKKTQTAWA